jgi:hypothetical protein
LILIDEPKAITKATQRDKEDYQELLDVIHNFVKSIYDLSKVLI